MINPFLFHDWICCNPSFPLNDKPGFHSPYAIMSTNIYAVLLCDRIKLVFVTS